MASSSVRLYIFKCKTDIGFMTSTTSGKALRKTNQEAGKTSKPITDTNDLQASGMLDMLRSMFSITLRVNTTF